MAASPPATEAPEGNGSLVPTDLPTDLPSARSSATPPNTRTGPLLGADISWPQCPKGMGIAQKRSEGLPLPGAEASFVIIGLTNGPSFYPNPCLAAQVAFVRGRHLLAGAYAVVSYPSAGTLRRYGTDGPYAGSTKAASLGDVGYQAALFNVASMKQAGLAVPFVWIDVESVPDFAWSTDLAANAAVVQGAVRGYRAAGLGVGFYSTPSLWSRVVGSLRTGAPEWRAAGDTSRAEAVRRCAPDWSFQGGAAVLGQWVESGKDQNISCPGIDLEQRGYFHQY
ncbi:MAG TPA: hypothetical protein VFE15_10560 [Marmoricola sp.]|jgi:hypothetical protein|nr:hypothetical protein [Marmoricola sp.]